MHTVAFIGLGNMGGPMAHNLLKGGVPVKVFDRVPALMQPLEQAGAVACSSAAEACKGAHVVISMLPASEHVESLYLSAEGLLPKLEGDTLIIDCSTIAPAVSRELAQAADDRGLQAIDAPVSGGTRGAANGTLTFIVGGKPDALERARPLLERMGKNIFHAGDAGAGQAAKLANNMLLGIQMIGSAEALSLGVANGLDPKILSDIIARSSGRNWAMDNNNPWPGVMPEAAAGNNYQGGFAVDLMLKDLSLATESALQNKRATPLGEMARNLFALHSQRGRGQLDYASVLELISGSLPDERRAD